MRGMLGKAPLALALVAAVCLAASRGPGKGEPAPDFSLTALDGKPLRLSNYRGRTVVLDFFASWCAPCREEIPQLLKLQQREGKRGVQVIGISLDDSAKPLRAMVRELHITYPVGMGDLKLVERYGGIMALPVIFVIGPDGRIVAKHLGGRAAAEAQADLRALRGARDGG